MKTLYNFSSVKEAQRYIDGLKEGQGLTVLFAGRGRRIARCCGKNRNGKTVIQTWDLTNEIWKKRRPMTIDDLLTSEQVEHLRINGRG